MEGHGRSMRGSGRSMRGSGRSVGGQGVVIGDHLEVRCSFPKEMGNIDVHCQKQ